MRWTSRATTTSKGARKLTGKKTGVVFRFELGFHFLLVESLDTVGLMAGLFGVGGWTF